MGTPNNHIFRVFRRIKFIQIYHNIAKSSEKSFGCFRFFSDLSNTATDLFKRRFGSKALRRWFVNLSTSFHFSRPLCLKQHGAIFGGTAVDAAVQFCGIER